MSIDVTAIPDSVYMAAATAAIVILMLYRIVVAIFFKLNGKSPAYAFVPILSTYVEASITEDNDVTSTSMLSTLMASVQTMSIPNVLNGSTDTALGIAGFSLIDRIVSMWRRYRLARKKETTKAFAIGLAILPIVFYPILTFRLFKQARYGYTR